jgi:hypothetical protein
MLQIRMGVLSGVKILLRNSILHDKFLKKYSNISFSASCEIGLRVTVDQLGTKFIRLSVFGVGCNTKFSRNSFSSFGDETA